MLRLTFASLACLLLTGCITLGGSEPSPQAARPSAPAAPPPAATAAPAVIATTMEVRVEDRTKGRREAVSQALENALANVTITEYQPADGKALQPILGSRVEGGRIIVDYARNTYRQLIRTSDAGGAILAVGGTDPGWYVVHSYSSTAGFDPEQPRKGQRACVVEGLALAPGVQPVQLKPGEAAYFGHYVFTIRAAPGRSAPVELAVADARIEAAPPGLDDMLRRQGLDPGTVRRLPPAQFPCPWTVPRG